MLIQAHLNPIEPLQGFPAKYLTCFIGVDTTPGQTAGGGEVRERACVAISGNEIGMNGMFIRWSGNKATFPGEFLVEAIQQRLKFGLGQRFGRDRRQDQCLLHEIQIDRVRAEHRLCMG